MKSAEMKFLEESFASIKSSPGSYHGDDLKNIERVINRRYDLNVRINIVKNEHMKFFGMNIYPTEDVIDQLVDATIKGDRLIIPEGIWGKNKDWHIDVDSLLLYDARINANPGEIVAVLLHEIGHTIRSNDIPRRVGRIMKYTYLHLPLSTKKVLQWSKARKVLGLAFIEGCSNINFHSKELQEELAADKFVLKEGYGEDLSNFLTKLIKKTGNALVDRSEAELNKEIDTILTWVINNVSELDFRKNHLNKNLQGLARTTKSSFVKEYISSIRSQFFGDTTDTYRNLMIEQEAINTYKKYQVVTEAFKDLFNRNGRIDKITPSEIDMIMIEANRIENENDRLYVLELIYNKMDIVDLSLDLLDNPDTAGRVQVTRHKLNEQKNELLAIRKQVMMLKFQPKSYDVFVTYPSGYEG